MSDEIERTTQLGLFNYARSYWRSAEHLHAAQLKLTHPTAPVSFLFYHAIELYLKAFLLSQSLTLQSLKSIGHRVDKAGEKAIEMGLLLMDEDKEVISIIGDGDNVINSRYIVTGAFSRPAEDALSRTCQSLDSSIGKKLVELGIPVRETLPFRYAAPTTMDFRVAPVPSKAAFVDMFLALPPMNVLSTSTMPPSLVSGSIRAVRILWGFGSVKTAWIMDKHSLSRIRTVRVVGA
jgi:hypothetical protein